LRRLTPLLLVASLALPGQGWALECPQATMRARIDAADAAFVGSLTGQRLAPDGERYYRFDVAQAVKGPVGAEIEVRSPLLVDANDREVPPGADVGVLARLDGATFTTTSCAITDPGALLAEADEPRGGWIKLLIGAVILVAAIVYSVVRLSRRPRADGRTG
jgi:hypothetical protein